MLQVLIVDDNPTQLDMRASVLRTAGRSVLTANTAESAIARLRDPATGGLGAVVTDHVLPGENGAVFVQQLRELQADLPVIVVSGMAEAEQEYWGLEVRFLHKPCPPEERIRWVEEALRQN